MSDDETTPPREAIETQEQRTAKRLRQELAAFEADQRAQVQQRIDWWVQSQRDVEAEYRRLMRELNPTGLKIW